MALSEEQLALRLSKIIKRQVAKKAVRPMKLSSQVVLTTGSGSSSEPTKQIKLNILPRVVDAGVTSHR